MTKKVPIKMILSMAAVFFSFLYNQILGIVVLGVFIIYMLISGRSVLHEVFAASAYKKGDMDNALRLYEKASKSSQNPRPKITYAYLLLKAGKIDESDKVFQSIINSDLDEDSESMAKSNYALVLWKKDQLDEAVDMLSEVIKNYKSSIVYGSLGYLLILKGDISRALEFNKEAYGYNDSDAIIVDNLGHNYYLADEIVKAEEIYEELMKLKPEFPEAYYNYSQVLMKNKKLDKALEVIKKALEYKLSFLSHLTKADLESQLKEIEHLISIGH
ncbi:UNVERIFIED_CONTAM: tetratricopeptide repeat protein [Acetivibrio alkalicellulosi]